MIHIQLMYECLCIIIQLYTASTHCLLFRVVEFSMKDTVHFRSSLRLTRLFITFDYQAELSADDEDTSLHEDEISLCITELPSGIDRADGVSLDAHGEEKEDRGPSCPPRFANLTTLQTDMERALSFFFFRII